MGCRGAFCSCHTEPVTTPAPTPTLDGSPGATPARLRDHRERRFVAALVALTLAAGLWASLWAVLNPPFRAPDEFNHLNSALRIAHGGGWPEPGGALIAPAVERAMAEGGWPGDLPGGRELNPEAPAFTSQTPVPRAERYRIDAADAVRDRVPGSDDDAAAASINENAPTSPDTAEEGGEVVDQMTQHPPGWYALGGGLLRVTGLDEGRWDHALLALRLLDAVLLTPVVPLAAASVLRLTGSRGAALAAAAFPLAIPQVGHIMGAATNDALIVTLGALATYLAVRVVTGDARWRVALGLGAVAGAAMLTKLMGAFLVPTVLLAYLLARGAWRGRALRCLAALAVAFAVGGWWWAKNLLTLGTLQPAGAPRDVSWIPPVPGDQVLYRAVRAVARSFFGSLGWLEIWMPYDVVWLAVAIVTAAAVTALTVRGARRAALTVLALPVALWAGVIANALGFWQETGRLVALQGRYVFGGLAALAVVVGIAVWQACRRREDRLALAAPVVVVAALLCAAGGLWWGFGGMYRADGETVGTALERWAAWAPVAAPWLIAVGSVTAAAFVAALLLAARWAQHARGV